MFQDLNKITKLVNEALESLDNLTDIISEEIAVNGGDEDAFQQEWPALYEEYDKALLILHRLRNITNYMKIPDAYPESPDTYLKPSEPEYRQIEITESA